ncbi:MAG: DUF2207 domain-containing protein [Nitrospirae bacterium]|nr:DUF2207 domain-containing protein [Nitrospirota bacterium]
MKNINFNFKHKLSILITALMTWALSCPALAQDFTINNFRADIVINKDSSFTVIETLDVEFNRPRHGIFRTIPFKYHDSSGTVMKTPVKVLSVTDGSNNKLISKITREGNAINIRIGDPDIYVSGIKRYELIYEVNNAILFFDDHDELYWNVTGDQWQSEIKTAECSVIISGEKSRDTWASCYTGVSGSDEKACAYSASDDPIVFKTVRSLSPGEGLTIAYRWNKGIVAPPSEFKKILWFLGEIWVFIFPAVSLTVMFSVWYRRGRDPRVKDAVTVMYEPPVFNNSPLCPAEVGTLIDETLDPRDITATIAGLAVKGYIKIEEKKEEGIIFDSTDYYLTKIKVPDDGLSLFEKKLMSDVFGSFSGTFVSELKNHFYANIKPLQQTVYSELISKKYFSLNPDNVRKTYAIAGIIISVISVFLLNVIAGYSVNFGIILLAGILTGAPVLGFSKYMPAKTKAGSLAYMEVLGFEEFLNRAEKDRLERMKDENLFSKYFPYALALNVADNWARAFDGIYQKQPDWYVSSGGFRTFSPAGFTHSVNSAMSNLSTAMYSAPRSSGIGGGGFGGGGSSGGGFGGGGGGSW